MTTQTKQTEVAIKHTRQPVVVDLYEWTCPGCGNLIIRPDYEPDVNDPYEVRCRSCQNDYYEQQKANFVAKFKEIWGEYTGATVVDIEPDMENWHEDWRPDYADPLQITIEKAGIRYKISSAHDTHYLFIRKDTLTNDPR